MGETVFLMILFFETLLIIGFIIYFYLSYRKRQKLGRLGTIHKNYSKLVNSSVIGMFIGSEDESIVEANDAFLNMLEYSREEFKSRNIKWGDLVAPQYRKTHEETLKGLGEWGFVGPVEKEYISSSGKHVPVILSGVLISKSRMRALCLVTDISERKKLELKKDEFISIASHEFKTPLTTLKGYVQLFNKDLTRRYEENLKYGRILDNQVLKLTELVNDLLDISKIDTGRLTLDKTEFEMGDLLGEVIEELKPISKNHNVNFFKVAKKAKVVADKVRISQILNNLITNAIKYSGDGTVINIKMEADDKNVKVSVQDHGRGIPEDKLKAIFDKFYRLEDTKSHSQGLGLGLYISSQIARYHGGDIEVETELGEGSTFTLTLPRV